MAESEVKSLRASPDVWARAAEAAKRSGMKLGPWCVMVIDGASDPEGEAQPAARTRRAPAAAVAEVRESIQRAAVKAAGEGAGFGPVRAAPGARLKRRP